MAFMSEKISDTSAMNKNTYTTAFIAISVVMTGVFIMSETIWEGYQWINKLIGLVGVLLSLGGVVMALIQIEQTDIQIKLSAKEIDSISKETERIQIAVKQNRDEIKDFLSISEVAHLVESIRNAQVHVRQEAYSNAVLLLQMIKDNLLRTNSQFDSIILQLEIDMPDIIKKLSIDIESLTKHGILKKAGRDNTSSIRPDTIHKHLELACEAVIKIESTLKQKRI